MSWSIMIYIGYVFVQVVEVTMRSAKMTPHCSNSQELCGDVMNSLNAIAGNPVGEELRQLLQRPNVKVKDITGYLYM